MNTLFVLLGATGVGKTYISIEIAKKLGLSVVSCDSRQIYKELKIGVATPTPKQLSDVNHFFIGSVSIEEHYSAGQYEQDAIPIIEDEIYKRGDALLVGGSMMYIDAVCKGIDNIPYIDQEIRQYVIDIYDKKGIDEVRKLLFLLDKEHYYQVDLKNVKRMLHAIEVCFQSGKPFSQLRTNTIKTRSFKIKKIGIGLEKEKLYEKINNRVLSMIEEGFEDEASELKEFRHLNALNTVGYKEFFAHFDGMYDRNRAIELIQRNTRHYAKKQLSWFNRDKDIKWFEKNDLKNIINYMGIKD